jgi:ABC-type transport system substrate-binding protein
MQVGGNSRLFKSWFFLILLGVLVILTTLTTQALGKESVIRWSCTDWKSMDPAFITLQNESSICMNIYSGLVKWKYGTTEIVPDLAESWDISKDGLVYTFHLRKGVKWQKGYGELTAQDVKYSFERILNPETKASLAKHYAIIKQIDAVDKYTVKMTLKEPYAPFLQRLIPYKAAGIVKKEAVEKWGDEYGLHPVGTGPFEWVSGDPRGNLVLKAFDDYYAGRSKLDKIIFIHVSEDPVAYAAFEGGDLDIVNVSDPEMMEKYRNDPNIEVQSISGLNLNYIIMNTRDKPFNDIRVRQAANHAVNKKAILETVLKGIGADLIGPVPASANYFEPDVETYPYDPEKAKKLLAEAGYPNGLKTTLYTYIGGPAVPVSTAIQDQLKKVGINAELKALEIAAWMDVVTTGTTPMSFMRITRPPDPDGFLLPVVHTKSDPQWNFGHYKNPKVNELIDEGRRVTDPAQRREIYSKLQKIVAEDVPNVWIFSNIIATAYRPSVKGFKLDALWNKLLYEAYIAK